MFAVEVLFSFQSVCVGVSCYCVSVCENVCTHNYICGLDSHFCECIQRFCVCVYVCVLVGVWVCQGEGGVL